MGNFKGFLKEWTEMPLFNSSNADPELIEKTKEIQKQQNPFWVANSLQGFGTGTMPCVRERLGELPMPVQLIVGEKDSKFLHINRQMEKEIPNSELSVVKEAGHRVHLDQPEHLITQIKNFI
jgi:2-succinyl-6-hydroxy-2,4-cyclohexadiene-1-carboxylate synthase